MTGILNYKKLNTPVASPGSKMDSSFSHPAASTITNANNPCFIADSIGARRRRDAPDPAQARARSLHSQASMTAA